jgi:hypothetical protein
MHCLAYFDLLHTWILYPSTAHYTGKSFDCHGYLSRYPDLQNAFGSDCTKAFNHYVKHGNSESRDASANEEEFQCESYLLRYPDLEAAFGHDVSLFCEYVMLLTLLRVLTYSARLALPITSSTAWVKTGMPVRTHPSGTARVVSPSFELDACFLGANWGCFR